jgi:rare lipoprotein A
MRSTKLASTCALALALAGCASGPAPTGSGVSSGAALPWLPAAGSGRGGYYKDDGPGDNPPAGLYQTPDAQVRIEPYSKAASRPYVIFGKTYTPITDEQPFSQRGVGSWYGKKFHGLPTSLGEPYDMYKMTAAHPTLPIPSYVRLTSIASGKQVIVRVNDRGPFHADRIVDVSYTAALKLGLLTKGSHELQLERLLASDIKRMLAQQASAAPAPAPAQLADDPVAAAESAVIEPLATAASEPAPVPPGIEAMMLESMSSEHAAVPAQQVSAATGSFYLQLGAYALLGNAETVRSRLAPYIDRLGALEIVPAGALHRLYGGPFQHRQDAVRAAAALPGALGVKPLVVQR